MKKLLDPEVFVLRVNVVTETVCLQINRLQALLAGVWPSCLGKCIVLPLKLCHCVLHWQQSERFIPLRLV